MSIPTNINNENEFSNGSANLVQSHSKDINYVVNQINRGEKFRETPIDSNIKNKFIAYCYELPYRMLDESSYIDLNKMKIVSSMVDLSEYKFLINKSANLEALKTLKMPLFLGFLNILRIIDTRRAEDVVLKEFTGFMKFNKKNIQQIWSEELRSKLLEQGEINKYDNKLGEIIEAKCAEINEEEEIILKELNELKTEKDDELEHLEWPLFFESVRMKIFKDDFNFNREIELKEKALKKIDNIEELTVKRKSNLKNLFSEIDGHTELVRKRKGFRVL